MPLTRSTMKKLSQVDEGKFEIPSEFPIQLESEIPPKFQHLVEKDDTKTSKLRTQLKEAKKVIGQLRDENRKLKANLTKEIHVIEGDLYDTKRTLKIWLSLYKHVRKLYRHNKAIHAENKALKEELQQVRSKVSKKNLNFFAKVASKVK